MTSAITVEAVSKFYQIGLRSKTFIDEMRSVLLPGRAKVKELWALKDVSFTVNQGEVLGIIGRNGAGKSTLLKILSRVTRPTTGALEIVGSVGSLLEVGVGFHPNLTGRENIFLCGAISGLKHKQISDRFDEIVQFSELEEFLDTPVRFYSSGMSVRLGFSVAAHLNQSIMIIDEALAVGDTSFQRKCWERINFLSKNGTTVLFVSHNVTLMSHCTKVLYLEKGQLKGHGPSETIVAQYLADVLGHDCERVERAKTLSHLFGYYGEKIQLHRMELLSKNHPCVPSGHPIEFMIELQPHADLERLRLVARIYSQTGLCVGSACTLEPFSVQCGQNWRAKFSIQDALFAPGDYGVRFTIVSADFPDVELDRVLIKPAFKIEIGGSFVDMDWQPDMGSVVFQSETTVVESGSY